MAENNNLGDFQDKIENISDVLDSMRSQNEAKSDVLEKILTNISLKLETLSDEDNTDLIKVFLSELRKNLDERHNFVSSKFNEIEASFNSLVEKTTDNIKADEMRQIFDIIATNLGVFSTEVVSQKELLAELNKQIEDFKQDDSQKKDILKNISVLKIELEKFNNGFQSIILNLNDNFNSISQEVAKIDSTEMVNLIKKDIENIYFSSNAVLSTLQIIDRKNSEFEVFINTLVTKEEFTQEREQVEKLIEQNSQLTNYISNLPSREHIEDLSERVTSSMDLWKC